MITTEIDTTKARIYYLDGQVVHYNDQVTAYQTWLALPKGTRAAFRAKGDVTPVYSHDYVDR